MGTTIVLMKSRWPIFLITASLLAAVESSALANSFVNDEWDDWGKDDWSTEEPIKGADDVIGLSGFVEVGYGRRLQNDQAINRKTTLGEARARIEYQYHHELFSFEGQGDALYDDVLKQRSVANSQTGGSVQSN